MASKINMAAAFAMISVFLWSMLTQVTNAFPGPLHYTAGVVDGATHLQTIQSLMLGIGYTEGLIWLAIIATVIGSLVAQRYFDRTEI